MKKMNGGISSIFEEGASFDKDNLISYSKQVKNVFHLWLIDDIEDNKAYLKWFDVLQNATEDDLVVIHINCWGGNLFTAVQIVTQIKTCAAQVVCQIESSCCSAATIIALACDGLICYPHGYMMIHTSSGCAFGKQSDIKKEEEFYNPWLANFFHEIYKDFLSRKEIQNVLDGHDMWLNADEVMSRFQHKVDVINKANAKAKKQEKEHMKKIYSFMSQLQHKDDEVGQKPSENEYTPPSEEEGSSGVKGKPGGKKKGGKKRKPSSK